MLGLQRRWIVLAVAVAAIKVILATLASMSYDFIGWIEFAGSALQVMAAGGFPMFNVYTGPALFFALFYDLWLALPITHPSPVIGIFYFNPTPEAFLLVLIMKTPILLFDLLAGLLIYSIVRDVTSSKRIGGGAFLLWYLNPYNVFMIEIWGSFDIIPAALLLLAVLFGYRRRWVLTGATLFLATALRLFPILLLPVFLLSSARQGRRPALALMLSFLIPLATSVIAVLYRVGISQALFNLNLSLRESWAQEIYGFPITSGLSIESAIQDAPVTLFLFLYPVQLYLMGRLFKDSLGLTELSAAILLVLFTSIVHEPYHFTWVTPLLTAYYGVRRDRPTLYLLILVFISAFVWMLFFADVTALGNAFFFFPTYSETLKAASKSLSKLRDILMVCFPLFAGVFYGIKAAFLLKLNLQFLRVGFIQQSDMATLEISQRSSLSDDTKDIIPVRFTCISDRVDFQGSSGSCC